MGIKRIFSHNPNRLLNDSAAKTYKNDGHKPVMLREVLNALMLQDGDTILDMTFGAGGHSKAILERNDTVRILALDRDPVAHQNAVKMQSVYGWVENIIKM